MLLPFTRTEFLQVFAAYNTSIWPLQLIATILALVAIGLLLWRSVRADRTIALILSCFWLVTGVGYHWMFFAAINEAAPFFAALFVVQALLFFVVAITRSRLIFEFTRTRDGWLALLLVIYAAVVYPLIGLLVTQPWPETPLLGVTPCPTTIFTLGFTLLARHPVRAWLAAIPLLWGLIGGSAALLLNVPQDFGLIVASGISIVMVIRQR